MNLIYIALILGDIFSIFCSVLFVITHAYLSAFMFFLVDCIYRRFYTRSIVLINGILTLCPNLAISIFLMLICFSGLPGTVKFTVEFLLFLGLIEFSIFYLFFLFLINVLGLIGFSKN
jgi:NADH:ubiquinone oxidoreductase subunit 4 (subunit M)